MHCAPRYPSRVWLALAAVAAALATLAPAPALATTLRNAPDPIPNIVSINLGGIDLNGRKETVTAMQVLVYLPGNAKINPSTDTAPGGPYRILLYAHGRPAYASERAKLQRPVHARHVHYWLSKGYAVVAPIRPGYGTSSAKDQESSGVGYSASGQCIRQPTPAHLAANAGRAMRAALDWTQQQPWARANHIVLEGQSAGGLATVALCSGGAGGSAPNAPLHRSLTAPSATPPSPAPGIVGCINFSGGAGGDPQHAPGKVCAPEKITALMLQYGSTTHAPSLWLYAPNDLYWGAAAPQQWHRAFNQAAAAANATPATFYQSPAIGSDGHSLQRAGSTHWAPVLDAWLKKNKL